MVPEAGTAYGAGLYENSYDSDVVCEIPPERPEWGSLTWTGSTPSDSEVVFEFFTADTLAELDSVIPVAVTYTNDPVVQTHVLDIRRRVDRWTNTDGLALLARGVRGSRALPAALIHRSSRAGLWSSTAFQRIS